MLKKIDVSIKNIMKISKIFIKNYFSSDLSLLASNLTYMMILTIFPFFAIVIGVSKGFGLDTMIISKIYELIPQNEKILNYAINVTNNIIYNARSGILTGLGILILIYSVISMLDLLETTFNNIWHVNEKRAYSSKIVSYIAIIFIAPIFLLIIIASSSIIVEVFTKYLGQIGILFKMIIKLLNTIFRISFILGMFVIIPNKRVYLLPAIIGAIITDTGLIILYYIYMFLQKSISSYNFIYGSLAFIPIFLIWMKYLWTIILIGAQITYSIQTASDFVEEKKVFTISIKKKLAIYLLNILIKRFENNEKPYTLSELKDRTSMPKYAIREGLYLLQRLSLINEINDEKIMLSYYQINVNPKYIKVDDLIKLIEEFKDDEMEDLTINMNEKQFEEYSKIVENINFENKKLIKNLGEKYE